MRRHHLLLSLLLITLTLSSCSMFARAPQQPVAKGRDTVLILFNSTGFREAVVANVVRELKAAKLNVVMDNTKRAKFYAAADYAAVVHISEYWAWHVPYHAKRYFKRNSKADNIVFAVTSGDPNVTITKPFDAVTGASKKDGVGKFSAEIMGKLTAAMK